MRFQSSFEKITQGTSQKLFALCFVTLRITIGLGCFYLATQLLHLDVSNVTNTDMSSTSSAMQVSDLGAIKDLFGPGLIVFGSLFVLGFLVRPAAVLVITFLVINGLTSGSTNPVGVMFSHGLVALGLSLFAAGGSGHVLGLDGIISRNIRRPNAVTKFLFG